jgi:hypothetical protein
MATSFAIRKDVSKILKQEYKELLDKMSLEELVEEFISYLDYQEESDSGRVFNPITIGSCRVLMSQPLDMVLTKLREKKDHVDKYHRTHEIHEGNCVTCYDMSKECGDD